MPPDRHYVEDSLGALEENLRFLRDLASRPEDQFVASREASYSAAYALMICIAATAGIAGHLLSSTGRNTPKGMAGSFEQLHAEGILSSGDLAVSLAKMSRFRNLIVHRYWKVDYATVHDILLHHLDDFRAFAAEIETYLSENEGGP